MTKKYLSRIKQAALLSLALFLFPVMGGAESFTFSGTTLGGSTVDGLAVLTGISGSSSVSITLTNNITNIENIGQAISGLTFQVLDGNGGLVAISPVTITSQSGRVIDFNGCSGSCDTVAEKTAFDVGGNSGADTLNWGLTTQDPAYLNALGFTGGSAPPDELILGAPTSGLLYNSANSSILKSEPHQPFVAQTANFVVSLGTNLPTNFQFTNVTMFFGTNADKLPPRTVPEPTSLVLLGSGLAAMVWARRRVTARS